MRSPKPLPGHALPANFEELAGHGPSAMDAKRCRGVTEAGPPIARWCWAELWRVHWCCSPRSRSGSRPELPENRTHHGSIEVSHGQFTRVGAKIMAVSMTHALRASFVICDSKQSFLSSTLPFTESRYAASKCHIQKLALVLYRVSILTSAHA